MLNPNQTEKRLSKPYLNKNRQLTNNIVSIVSQTSDGINVVATMENRIQNSNTPNPKSALSVCKAINSPRQNVTMRPVRTPNLNMSHVRPVAIVPPEISKTPTRVQPPDMEHLNEQIKQAKFKQLQKQHIEKPRFQQNNTQRQHSNALQHVPAPLSTPTRRFVNSVQRTQQISISPQQIQKPSVTTPTPSSAEHNTRVTNMNVSPPEVSPPERVQEKGHVTQQSSSPRLEPENSASESVAYLQKTINDPANAIVQHQIQGNTAKMLVMLPTGEQRLITFDIPNEDCTVHDLLDQVRAVLGKVCFYKDL